MVYYKYYSFWKKNIPFEEYIKTKPLLNLFLFDVLTNFKSPQGLKKL